MKFSVLWEQLFAKRLIPSSPLIHQLFLVPEIFWNTERFPHYFFRQWLESFWPKTVIQPPFIQQSSIIEHFWKTEAFPHEVFRFGPMGQKTFDKVVMPPSCSRKFAMPEIPWNAEVFAYEVFRYYDNFFSSKPWEASTNSNLKSFRYRTVFEKQALPYEVFHFGPVRRKSSTKLWCSSSNARKFSSPQVSWNTEGFAYEVFQYCEKKYSPRPWYAPSYLKSFSIRKVSWNTKGFVYGFSRHS